MSRRTLLLNGPSAKAALTLAYGIMSGKGLCAFIALSMSVALLSPGCNSPDRVLIIPAAEDTAPKSIEGIENYPVALSAIVSVMVRELNLPEPHGQVYFYRDAGAYQAALGAEIKSRIHRWEAESTEIKRVQHQLEFELFKRTVDLAMHTAATTVGQKVFVAEWTIMRIPWQKRFRILAHELAHVVASSLAAGHVQRMHRWLMEGFAEWVSFKVVDALGTQNFFYDQMRQACGHEIANLRELKAPENWLQPKSSHDLQSHYSESACAVHYIIVKNGVSAILEYFRLFKDRDNGAKNFDAAFGESSYTFEQKIRAGRIDSRSLAQ